MRPFRDSDIEREWVWRRAAPGAVVYPHLHFFLNSDYLWHNSEREGLGELPDTPRPYNAALPVPGLLGHNPCGPPSWFEFGQPLTATGDCEQEPGGIPACCGHQVVHTGAAISGLTSVGVGPLPPPPPPSPTGAAISGSTVVIPPDPPVCVTPGTSAATTTPAPLNRYCPFPIQPEQETWYYWVVIPGVRYRLSVIDDTCSTGTWWVWGGVGEPTVLLHTGAASTWPLELLVSAPVNGVWFQFLSDCTTVRQAHIGLFEDPQDQITEVDGEYPDCASAFVAQLNRVYLVYADPGESVWLRFPVALAPELRALLEISVATNAWTIWEGSVCPIDMAVFGGSGGIGSPVIQCFRVPDAADYWWFSIFVSADEPRQRCSIIVTHAS
jgi:hypothetical protein